MRKIPISSLFSALITVLGLIVVWEITVQIMQIPARTLPAPSAILLSAWNDKQALLAATVATAQEVFWGMLIGCFAGVVLGVVIYASKILKSTAYPLLVAAQTVPIIAIAPLIMLWMGFEISGKILLVAVYASFPVVAACVRGISSVPEEYALVARTLGAQNQWILWRVRLRGAWPTIMSGIKISATYAFGTAAMSEYVGAAAGLGVYLNSAKANYRTDLVFATAFTLAICTLILFGIIALGERALVRWPQGKGGAQ